VEETVKSLLKAIDATSEWSGKVVGFSIYAGTVVLIWEIIMRYAFNAPTMWAHETSLRFFAAYYMLSGAYVLRHRSHINIDVIYNLLSLRGRAIIDLIAALFLFAMCGAYLWYGFPWAWKSVLILETDPTPLRAPLYPMKLMVPLGAFLLLLQGLANFSRDFITAVTGRQYEY